MVFEFTAFNPDISEIAQKLAKKYGYRPYMVERYLSMFGEDETQELLHTNEILSPLTIRINSLKSSSNHVKTALEPLGYKFTQSETIPYAFSIENQKIDSKPKKRKLKEKDTYQQQRYERDSTTLKQVEWGRPSYQDEEQKAKAEQQQLTKTTQQLRGRQIGTLGSTHEYLMGNYYIQDLASMFPPFYLNPQSSDFVVDMCAAPGGKTSHLAQIMENNGNIFALDNNKKRIKPLVYNLRRCGVRNTTVLHMDSHSLHKQSFHPDKILLDAPCTGEGLIRDDPSRKTSKKISDITGMMRKQYSLLQTAIKALKPGGQIMYSTCSIAPEENEFVIQNALDSFNDIEILPTDDEWGLPGFINVFGMELSDDFLKARRLFPHINNTIGFFYCLIQKKK